MKRTVTAVVLALCLVLPSALAAHPPSDIKFTFDMEKSTVTVDIFHQVKNPADHFIHEIELKVNGKKAIKQDATVQTSAEKQSVVYVIPGLKAGDRVSVTGDCNKYGILTIEAVAQQPVKSEPVKAQKVK
ncbi:MAG: hypothetical protein LLG37_08605 [Spirochaetia bacterium]|nr:hypothetical protein [Spirochaetia bacterium]